MDKLELDARVARLERRFSLLVTVPLLAVLGVVLLLFIGARIQRAPTPPAVAAPLPTPIPNAFVRAADPGMGMMSEMGMMGAPNSMGMLSQEIATLRQLKEEGLISDSEWRAKKAQALTKELNPGDLRADLQQVQQLFDSGAIDEAERSALRSRLLGIGEPDAAMPER